MPSRRGVKRATQLLTWGQAVSGRSTTFVDGVTWKDKVLPSCLYGQKTCLKHLPLLRGAKVEIIKENNFFRYDLTVFRMLKWYCKASIINNSHGQNDVFSDSFQDQ